MPTPTFEFATANRIIFGANTIHQIPGIVASYGQRVLLVTAGQSTETQADQIEQQLKEKMIAVTRFSVTGEPDVETVETGVQAAQAANCDVIIALGGGSVIDAGKAIAGLLTNGGGVLDYVEVVGRGQTIKQPAAPMIAIPTTAGTGAEVTRNAVIAVNEKQVKVSMRSPYLLPRVAVVDPTMTYTMPPDVTASTGLDALTQLIEPLTSSRRNPLVDGIATEGLKRAARSVKTAYQTGDPAARDDMAFASLCGGLALANAGLGAAHGFASVIGGRYPIPHGVCCATLLPYVVEANIQAILARDPQSDVLERYRKVARYVAPGEYPTLFDFRQLIEALKGLCKALNIPPLAAFGVTAEAIPDLVAQSQQASSMKANPIVLTAEELTHILQAAL
ncbi:MAG: iron-containing alcohol dehydrogenase [Anaerolineae bacterium]|nr:iron-containing alcohol dehydrogenase [Anaerolineae bacterium]